MSYNIMAETDQKINWDDLNCRLDFNKSYEVFPMPGRGVNGGDALGISIPSKKIHEHTWCEIAFLIDMLKEDFKLELYDLYFGIKIVPEVMDKIKMNLGI